LKAFVHSALPGRVVFGVGALEHLAREIGLLGAVGMVLHHKLCHVLGGTWNLPHAERHTVVLPHALAYNCAAAPEAMRRIGCALTEGATRSWPKPD
jgi:alcohol dehydrogenase YqhD (iron-dependent ADH family)